MKSWPAVGLLLLLCSLVPGCGRDSGPSVPTLTGDWDTVIYQSQQLSTLNLEERAGQLYGEWTIGGFAYPITGRISTVGNVRIQITGSNGILAYVGTASADRDSIGGLVTFYNDAGDRLSQSAACSAKRGSRAECN